mgnify:CR=1 FL=1
MCQKIPYTSKSDAAKDYKRMQAEKRRFSRRRAKHERKGDKKLYPYLCPSCHYWHLTTIKQKA